MDLREVGTDDFQCSLEMVIIDSFGPPFRRRAAPAVYTPEQRGFPLRRFVPGGILLFL
jgi:hypothetical protein